MTDPKMSKRERELREDLAKAQAALDQAHAEHDPAIAAAKEAEEALAKERAKAGQALADARNGVLVKWGILAKNGSEDASQIAPRWAGAFGYHKRLVESVSAACGWPADQHDDLKPANHGDYINSPFERACFAVLERAAKRADKDPVVAALAPARVNHRDLRAGREEG